MSGSGANESIRRYVERLEALDDEKRNIAEDMRGVFRDAKGEGFDVKAIREVLRLRRMEPQKRQEMEFNVEAYRAALGDLASLPLGEAAVERAAKH